MHRMNHMCVLTLSQAARHRHDSGPWQQNYPRHSPPKTSHEVTHAVTPALQPALYITCHCVTGVLNGGALPRTY